MTDYSKVCAALAGRGFRCRGGFHPGPEDGVPGTPATVILAGSLGASIWPAFAKGRRSEPEPLDAWTERTLDRLAAEWGALALYPFQGPPYLPFQQWAMRAEGLKPSPLGILMHPEFGLWHAYRGALAFAEAIELPAPVVAIHPCDGCPRPCLAACPVGAFGAGAYDVPACVAHLAKGGECLERGCLARRACPVGREHAYPPPLARFHMEAFLWTQGGGGS